MEIGYLYNFMIAYGNKMGSRLCLASRGVRHRITADSQHMVNACDMTRRESANRYVKLGRAKKEYVVIFAKYSGEMVVALNQVKVRIMEITDYDLVIDLWKSIEGIGLSDADSKGNIKRFLHRNPGLSLVA